MASPRACQGLPDRPVVPANAEAAPWWAALANGTEANFITDDLFLGAVTASEDMAAMKKRGITHILTCHPDLPQLFPQHFRYARLPLPDEPAANMLELLPDGLAFLCDARARGGKTFVLCAKGISRSASVCTALLMFEKGVGFEEALRMVQRRRPIAFPNAGFQAQLRHLEVLLGKAGHCDAPWQERLERLRSLVPRGLIEGPEASFLVREAIAANMRTSLEAVAALAQRCAGQPALSPEDARAWRQLGLYFEGVHKYGALPSDPRLIGRARTTAGKLRQVRDEPPGSARLPRAVAQELESWAAWAAPRLGQASEEEDEEDEADQELAVTASLAPSAVGHGPSAVLGGAYDSSSEDEAPAKRPRVAADRGDSGS